MGSQLYKTKGTESYMPKQSLVDLAAGYVFLRLIGVARVQSPRDHQMVFLMVHAARHVTEEPRPDNLAACLAGACTVSAGPPSISVPRSANPRPRSWSRRER
jgi:hypothetical protein